MLTGRVTRRHRGDAERRREVVGSGKATSPAPTGQLTRRRDDPDGVDGISSYRDGMVDSGNVFIFQWYFTGPDAFSGILLKSLSFGISVLYSQFSLFLPRDVTRSNQGLEMFKSDTSKRRKKMELCLNFEMLTMTCTGRRSDTNSVTFYNDIFGGTVKYH